jgi:hypothetical protein
MSTKPGDETMIDIRALARKSNVLSDLSDLARRAASTSPVGTQDIGQTVVIREPQPAPAPEPSLLYADDHSPPIFLSGELGDLVCETLNSTRNLALSWGGVLRELRPAERERVGPLIERLRRLTIELHEQANAIDDAFEAIHDERQALEDDSE